MVPFLCFFLLICKEIEKTVNLGNLDQYQQGKGYLFPGKSSRSNYLAVLHWTTN